MKNDMLIGVFNDEDSLLDAFRKVKGKGVCPVEVFTPYPIHEILVGMGKKTRITHAAFFYGLFSAIGILAFLYYAAVIDWPLNYGGKPFNTFPSFIVVIIVTTILAITLLTLFTFSARAKIFPGKKPVIVHRDATNDKFVMVIDKNGLGENYETVQKIITEHGIIE